MTRSVLRLHKRADKSGDEPPRDDNGRLTRPWPVGHVELEGDPPSLHEFATSFVQRGLREGWLSLSSHKIVLHLRDQDGDSVDLTYEIKEWPNANEEGGDRDFYLGELVNG